MYVFCMIMMIIALILGVVTFALMLIAQDDICVFLLVIAICIAIIVPTGIYTYNKDLSDWDENSYKTSDGSRYVVEYNCDRCGATWDALVSEYSSYESIKVRYGIIGNEVFLVSTTHKSAFSHSELTVQAILEKYPNVKLP